MRVFLVTLLSLSLVYGLPLPAAKAASPEAVYGKNGMVASRSTLASQAGIEVMQAGGNAVDAAVATAFALAVTYPSAGNIGGGGFAVVRLADGKVVTLDHREMAPGAAHRDMFLDDDGEVIKGLSTRSHLAAGVPGQCGRATHTAGSPWQPIAAGGHGTGHQVGEQGLPPDLRSGAAIQTATEVYAHLSHRYGKVQPCW